MLLEVGQPDVRDAGHGSEGEGTHWRKAIAQRNMGRQKEVAEVVDQVGEVCAIA